MNLPIDLHKLISVKRIFEISPEPTGFYLYLFILFGLLFVGAVILKIFSAKINKHYRKNIRGLSSLMLISGIVGGSIVFFRWQSIPYLGSRFALLVLAVIGIVWLSQILIDQFVNQPKKMKHKKEIEEFSKYLPQIKAR